MSGEFFVLAAPSKRIDELPLHSSLPSRANRKMLETCLRSSIETSETKQLVSKVDLVENGKTTANNAIIYLY